MGYGRVMNKSSSYRARAMADCIVLGEVVGQTCWGVVRYSPLNVYLCEGHRKPPDYLTEPTPKTAEEWAQIKAETEAKAASDREIREAARWFRPLIPEVSNLPVSPFWSALSAVMLSFLHSGLGEVHCSSDVSEKESLRRLGGEATAEILRRKLPWPDPAYTLALAGETEEAVHSEAYSNPFGSRALALPLDLLPDTDVQLLYGVAAHVADYSCLERGVRQVVSRVLCATRDHLCAKGLDPQFLKGT